MRTLTGELLNVPVLPITKSKPLLLHVLTVPENPGLKPLETYVVPLNVDYTWVREAREMVSEQTGSPRTLHLLDSFAGTRKDPSVRVHDEARPPEGSRPE